MMKEKSDHTFIRAAWIVEGKAECGRSYGKDAERKDVEPAACYAWERSIWKPHTGTR